MTAMVGMLLWLWVLAPLAVPMPSEAGWRCHTEWWPLPVERICAPIQEDDPEWDCATMGNRQCGRVETEWS